DTYITETSRHADIILPAPSPLARDHYDVVFASLAVRNTARWTPAVFPLSGTERDEGETLLQLAAIAASVVNAVPEPTIEQMDDLVAFEVARRVCPQGMEPGEVLAAVAPRRGVPRLLDLSLRGGPYADQGLDLAALEAA